MDDEEQKRRKELFDQEYAKLKEIEEQRAFLKDRSVGGENALRPDDAFIDKSLGPERNPAEIAEAAQQKADLRFREEQKQTLDRQRFEESVLQHNASIEQRKREEEGQEPVASPQSGLKQAIANFRDQASDRDPSAGKTSFKDALKEQFGEKALQDIRKAEQERQEREREQERKRQERGR